jgi:hypothetical protein
VIFLNILFENANNLFNEDNHHKLKYYAVRNQGLSQLMVSPSCSVSREAWPRALAAACVYDHITVYRMLRVLGNSVGMHHSSERGFHKTRWSKKFKTSRSG